MLIQSDTCMTSFGWVRFKEEELYHPEKWCLWQKWQRIIHHGVFLCEAVIKPKWNCTSLVIYFTDHYIYTNSITLLHFYSAIYYSTSHTLSTWQDRNAAFSGEDNSSQLQSSTQGGNNSEPEEQNKNFQMNQGKTNIKQ